VDACAATLASVEGMQEYYDYVMPYLNQVNTFMKIADAVMTLQLGEWLFDFLTSVVNWSSNGTCFAHV